MNKRIGDFQSAIDVYRLVAACGYNGGKSFNKDRYIKPINGLKTAYQALSAEEKGGPDVTTLVNKFLIYTCATEHVDDFCDFFDVK